MNTRNPDRPEPPWVASMNDEEIVEKFLRAIDNPRVTYEHVGRRVIDMRKRLKRILIDGLAARQKEQS